MPARGFLEAVLQDSEGDAQGSASLYVYEPDGSTLIAQVIRDAVTGGNVLSNPLTSNSTGRIEAYVTTPQRVVVKRTVGGTAIASAFYHDPTDLVTLDGTQTLTGTYTGGTFTSPALTSPTITTPTFVGTSTFPASGLAISAISQPMADMVFGGIPGPRVGTRMQLTEGTLAAPADTDDEILNISRYWTHSADSITTDEIAGAMLTFQIPDVAIGHGVADLGIGMTFNGLWVRMHSFGTTSHSIIGQRIDSIGNGLANSWGLIIGATSQNGLGNQGIEIDLTNAHSAISALPPSNGTDPATAPTDFSVGINVLGAASGSGSKHHAAFYVQRGAGAEFWDGIRFQLGAIQSGGFAVNIGDMVAGSGALPLLLPNNVYTQFRDPTYAGANVNGFKVNGSSIFEIGVGATVNGVLTTTGTAYVGDTSNANVTKGLTLNQGAADDSILELKSSDVAHGITTATAANTETDTYFLVKKTTAASGGAQLAAFDGTAVPSLWLRGISGATSGARSTSDVGAVLIDGALKSTTNAVTLGADKNILAVRDNGTARFFLDSDGDSHQDVGTAWTTFDDHDDLAVLNSLAHEIARPDDPIKDEFTRWLTYNRADLERARLVQFNDDGHHFVNMSRLSMVQTGAIRQAGLRLDHVAARLEAVESKLLALGAG